MIHLFLVHIEQYMDLTTFLIILYTLIVIELFRNPSFLFAFAVGLFGLPAIGIGLGVGEFLLPVFEASVIIGILEATALFLLSSWFLIRVDVFLREHSGNRTVGKWTTISGLSGLLFLYFTYFSSSYWDTIPAHLAAQSPYSIYIFELSKIAIPLLLIGATWHPSRMIYYIIDVFAPHPTNKIAKILPYLLFGGLIYSISLATFSEGNDLSSAVDVFVLFIPAIVSISASVREYDRYGLKYHPPIGKNKINNIVYELLHHPRFVFPIAGLCVGVTASLFNAKFGVYESMEPMRFMVGIILGPLCFRLLSEFIPESIFWNFPENIFGSFVDRE